MATGRTFPCLGKQLRDRYVEATPQQCEPLTFGEFMTDDRFIVLPFPGDNSGHDGLRAGSHLFRKTRRKVNKSGEMFNAIRLSDKCALYFALNMPVLKVT